MCAYVRFGSVRKENDNGVPTGTTIDVSPWSAIESIDDFTFTVTDNTKDRISKIRIKMSLIEADYGGFSNIPVNHEFFDLRRELQQLERN